MLSGFVYLASYTIWRHSHDIPQKCLSWQQSHHYWPYMLSIELYSNIEATYHMDIITHNIYLNVMMVRYYAYLCQCHDGQILCLSMSMPWWSDIMFIFVNDMMVRYYAYLCQCHDGQILCSSLSMPWWSDIMLIFVNTMMVRHYAYLFQFHDGQILYLSKSWR